MTVSNRSGEKNFVTAMRLALAERYGDKSVGVGGVFQIENGSAKMHIMVSLRFRLHCDTNSQLCE